jgi:hypothetical protein
MYQAAQLSYLNMKKAPVVVLLIPLILFEIFLCSAFLPLKWQRAIDRKILGILSDSHDWTPITHPNLDQEIEQFLRDHLWLKFVLYSFTVLLLVGNALVIRKLWRTVAS